MAVKDKISEKRIPIFMGRDQAMTDIGVLHTKLLLRPDEAAAILRVSLSHVYAMIDEGLLASTGARPIRIKSQSVVKHLKSIGAFK